MSTNEVIAAILGLLLGYWIVSLFLRPRASPGTDRRPERPDDGGAANAFAAPMPASSPP
jgi:hypothetical protein